jgi:hypothetical protein
MIVSEDHDILLNGIPNEENIIMEDPGFYSAEEDAANESFESALSSGSNFLNEG